MADLQRIADDLSQLTVMEAAEVFFGESTHVFRPRKKR